MTSDVHISGFGMQATGASQSVNVASPLHGLLRKRAGLQRMLKQVERDIEFLERKQSLAEFVAADRINSGRTDIPALAEVVEWDVRFRAEYRHMHEVQNEAHLANTNKLELDPNAYVEGAMREVAEDPLAVLAEDDKIQALHASIDTYVEDMAFMRGAGFEAADPLVGIREPRLSTLHCPEDIKNPIAWWVGAYQRIGLL